jgi:hypothetical protein
MYWRAIDFETSAIDFDGFARQRNDSFEDQIVAVMQHDDIAAFGRFAGVGEAIDEVNGSIAVCRSHAGANDFDRDQQKMKTEDCQDAPNENAH